MSRSGLATGIFLLGTGLTAQADEITQYDYLGLPIETNTVAATVVAPSDKADRDYLDLPLGESSARTFTAVEPTRSVNNDYLDLPVEKAKAVVKTAQREAEFSYLY